LSIYGGQVASPDGDRLDTALPTSRPPVRRGEASTPSSTRRAQYSARQNRRRWKTSPPRPAAHARPSTPFSSRDALIVALIEAAREQGPRPSDAARVDTAPPVDAIAHFLDISWQLLRRYPLLFDPPSTGSHDRRQRPAPRVTAQLEQLIREAERRRLRQPTLCQLVAAAILPSGTPPPSKFAATLTTRQGGQRCSLDSTLRLCGARAPAARQQWIEH